MSTYQKLHDSINCYQLALIWTGGFLVTAITIIVMLLTALNQTDRRIDEAIKDFIEKQNSSTLESCRETADECHIEFVYDRDGNLLGGNVVGQSRK